MDIINGILKWLESNESLLSAMTGLAAIIGITYAFLAFIFPSVGRAVKKLLGHENEQQSRIQAAAKGSGRRQLPKEISGASIAVLPLRTLSTNEDDQNIAAGLSSEINADLAQVPDLRVASHLASIGFQGDKIDLKEVAEILSIRYVLTGSFQRFEGRMRLTVELTDVSTGEQLWASTYDRELEDLLTVQAEVSEAIVGAIGGELKLADTRIAFEAPTKRLDAWGLVQKAYNFWLTSFTQDDYDKSLALLRKAVAIDASYAGARASLAMILSQRTINGLSGKDFEKDRTEALEMIEEAVKLEPNDITVLENAGLVWTHHGHGLRAREALRHAVSLSPLDLIAWGYLGMNLGWIGNEEETEEALGIFERLLRLAPKHPSMPYWNYFKATTLTRLGRLEEAIEASDAAIKSQPHFYLTWINLANIRGRMGEYELAREMFGKSTAINPYLTADLAAERMREVCMTDEVAEPLISGLRAAGLLENSD